MNHYNHKSIPDEEFGFSSSSSFGDMTPQNFPQKKGTNHQIRRRIYPRKTGLTLKERLSMSRIVHLDPKLTPNVTFSNFQAEENFFIFKIFGTSQ